MRVVPSQNEPRPRAGERRHLTAMFCDLVDSSRLAERLDAEDWNDVVLDYYRTCRAVVRRFDGYVAQELGDGLLVYFGWPVAHEDDAYRAVCTGLALIDALRALDARLERDRGIRLLVRIGINTGEVVVGEMGDGLKGERATGGALNVAARLTAIATPGTVFISRATFDQVQGYFTYKDLGPHNLRNIANPVHVYHVVAESGATTRLDAVGDRGLTPFIGREFEFNTLLELWNRATSGQPQTVEISGEPGIGKSRLVRAVSEQIPNVIVFRCSPIDSGSALFPVTNRLERLLEFDQLEDPGQKLDRLEHKLQGLGFSLSDVVPLLASELSLPLLDRYPAPDLPIPKRRQQTLNLLVEWMLKEAEQRPLMAVWEDLHWADPSTIELLSLIIERATNTPLLTLLTFRPEFQPPWTAPAALTELALGRLERPAVEEMLTRITSGRSLPGEIVDQIVEKTDGVPLFVEELLKTVLDSGVVRDEGDHYVIARTASPIAIPATLEGSLMSRLDRLGLAKAIAQRGAVLGRAFSQDLMRAVLDKDTQEDEGKRTEAWLHAQQCLTQLVEAGVLRRQRARQTTYEFKHALIQDAAYESLLKRTRQAYHLQTARVLEEQFVHVVETQPELLARHYTEALQLDKALDYWQKAGEHARDRSANREAIHHFAEAHKVLGALPESEARDRRELVLRIANVTPVIAVEGYVAETIARTAERALVLCRKLGDADRLFPVLYTLWANRIVGAKYADALRLTEEFFREVSDQQDPAPRLMSHRLRGISLFMIGDLTGAQEHLQHSLKLYEPQRHSELKNEGYGQDPRSTCEAFMSLVRWLRGYSSNAAEYSRMSLEHAEQARHTNTWGYVLWFGAATFEAFRRDVARTAQHTSALITFAEKEGLPVWLAYARVLHGWTLAQTDRVEDGLAEMKTGLVNFEDASSTTAPPNSLHMGFLKSFLLSLSGEAYARLGRVEEGLAQFEAAWSFAEETGEAFWKAEVLRLKGELLLQGGGRPSDARCQEAEACFLKAQRVASAQGAKSLELRAAMSLSRLWCREKPADARRILAEAYEGFTEGFDSIDLRKARILLDELPVV